MVFMTVGDGECVMDGFDIEKHLRRKPLRYVVVPGSGAGLLILRPIGVGDKDGMRRDGIEDCQEQAAAECGGC